MKAIEFLQKHNARQQWHPMGHPNDSETNPPIIVAKGKGVYIEDIHGHKMVDGVGGLWNINCGYGRLEIKKAIVSQLDELVYYSTFRGTSHPRSIELSHKLAQMLEPEGMVRFMFSSGGSDAVETALRIARQYWKMLGYKDRYKFISLKQGYHGTHFGAASVNGNNRFRRNYEPLLPGCSHLDSPWLYRNAYTDDPVKLGEIIAGQLDREIQFQGADTVAAFIVEPVQGAGGVIVPPDNFLPLVREVCDRYGVLLIADEVITGFGRTGYLTGCRGYGVKPDMMCMAKGINSGYVPLGATGVNARIDQAFKENKDGFGGIYHGYTYSGHPVACAAAIAALDIVEKEDLPGNAARQGKHLMKRLKTFEEKFPFVGEVRGKGLMLAIEIVADKASKKPDASLATKIQEMAIRNGVIVRVSGNLLIISPPLVIRKKEVDMIVEAIDRAMEETKK
jgi:adenosylmethionine-8-amino-7-oxononanoate aminotransferase